MKQHGFEVEQYRFDRHPGAPRAWARVAAGVSLALAIVLATAGGSGASLLQGDGKAARGGDVKSAHEQDGCAHSGEDDDPGSGHHGQACDDATPAPGVGPDAVPTSTPPSPAPPPVTVSPPLPDAVPSRPPIAVPPRPVPVPPVAATPPSPVAVTPSERPTDPTLAAGARVRHSGALETAPETAPETTPEMAVPVRHGQFEFLRPDGIARLFAPVAQPVAALFLLAVLAVVFLLVSGRLDRRHPRLVGGPLDRRDEHLEFE